MVAEIRIGTQGLGPTTWIGSFYPRDIRPPEMIPFYARVFDTVELNTTFYNIPSVNTIMSWAERTPPGFVFSAKFPRRITHGLKLLDCDGEVKQFLGVMRHLGEKLGPLLIQLPPDYGEQYLHLLNGFVSELPRDEFAFVLEIRNISLLGSQLYDLLQEKRIGWCISHWRSFPVVTKVTAGFAYIRLTGTREEVSEEDLDSIKIDRSEVIGWFAEDIRLLARRVPRIYVYINNHYSGHAPATANQLKQLLGLPWVEPVNLWPKEPRQFGLGFDEGEADI